MKRSIMVLCAAFIMANAQEKPRLIITSDLLKEYKQTFAQYLKSKDSERQRLCRLTDDTSFFGGIMTSVIEFASPLLGFGNVDVTKAKLFLGRVFDEQKKDELEKAIAQIELSEDNIRYLQELFDALDARAYHRKSRPDIVEAMHVHRHNRVPKTELLGVKNATGDYVVKDADFFPYAVSNLFAFHILESDITVQKLGLEKTPRRPMRRPGEPYKKILSV